MIELLANPISINSILLLISLFIIFKSSENLIHGATDFGRRLGLSDSWLGLIVISTVMSFPVMLSSITGLLTGNIDVTFGSILGRNIFNLGIVVGTIGFFTNSKIGETKTLEKSFFVIWGIILFPLFLLLDGYLSRSDGAVLLLIFLFYLKHVWNAEATNEKLKQNIPLIRFWKEAITFILSFATLLFGTIMLVFTSLNLSSIFNIPSFITAITVIAIGSALPNFAVQYNAAKNRHEAIATGNILGSTIITFVFYFGLLGLFNPLYIEPSILFFGMVFFLFMVSIFMNVMRKKKITKRTSLVLLLFYFLFLGFELLKGFL